jgi:hypothetical protein
MPTRDDGDRHQQVHVAEVRQREPRLGATNRRGDDRAG